MTPYSYPDSSGHFGPFGGSFASETLTQALRELRQAWQAARCDAAFKAAFAQELAHYVGRPTPIYHARRTSEQLGGAQIFFKREDLNHTGAHKINNVIGQALLARRMGKTRIIAETGAGQHGVATATICARFGLECVIYMGAHDVKRQSPNVQRMKLLGATVVPVEAGSKTLKDALNEAMRDWVANVDNTFYIIGTVAGPAPYPQMVRDFQSIIGTECLLQLPPMLQALAAERADSADLAANRLLPPPSMSAHAAHDLFWAEAMGAFFNQPLAAGKAAVPDVVVACVGGGSNAIGMFYPFIPDEAVRLVGVEAAGLGLDTSQHAASLQRGSPGVLHGNRTYVLQDDNGQIVPTHSVSAGLDYPGVGPEHAWLHHTGRVQYVGVTDARALAAFEQVCRTEGIIAALESSHAIAHALELAPTMRPDQSILVCLSGRGDKDIEAVAAARAAQEAAARAAQDNAAQLANKSSSTTTSSAS